MADSHIVRLLGESKNKSGSVADSNTNEKPFWWRGNDLRIEFAATDRGRFLTASEVGTITAVVKEKGSGPDDDPLMIRTIGAGDCDPEFDGTQWKQGAGELCAFSWPRSEPDPPSEPVGHCTLDPGEYILIITHDDLEGDRNTFLKASIDVIEDQHDSISLNSPPSPSTEYRTSEESDARYAAKIEIIEVNQRADDAGERADEASARSIAAQDKADQAESSALLAQQEASIATTSVSELSASLQAIESAVANGDDYIEAEIADLPSTANSSGRTEIAYVYNDTSLPDGAANGRYFREEGQTGWSKVPGDLSERLLAVEGSTEDLAVVNSPTEVLPIHSREVGNGNSEIVSGFHIGGEKDGQIFPPQKLNSEAKYGGDGVYLFSADKSRAVRLLTESDLPTRNNSFVSDSEDLRAQQRQMADLAIARERVTRGAFEATTFVDESGGVNWSDEAVQWRGQAALGKKSVVVSQELEISAPASERKAVYVACLVPVGTEANITSSNIKTGRHYWSRTTEPDSVKGDVVQHDGSDFEEWFLPLHFISPGESGDLRVFIKAAEAGVIFVGLHLCPPWGDPLRSSAQLAAQTGTLMFIGNNGLTLASGASLVAYQDVNAVTNKVAHIAVDGTINESSWVPLGDNYLDQHNGGAVVKTADDRILHFFCSHGTNEVMTVVKSNVAEPIDQADWSAPFAVSWTGITKLTYASPFLTPDGRIYLVGRGHKDGREQWYVAWSDDDGATWPDSQFAIITDYAEGDAGRKYVKTTQGPDGDLHFVAAPSGFAENPIDLYYFRFGYADQTFRRADGTAIGGLGDLPVLLINETPFLEYRLKSNDDQTLLDAVAESRFVAFQSSFDSDGNPYLFLSAVQRPNDPGRVSAGDDAPDARQFVIRSHYANGQWHHEVVSANGDRFYEGNNGGLTTLGCAPVPDDPDECIIVSGTDNPGMILRDGFVTGDRALWRARRRGGQWMYERLTGTVRRDRLPHYLQTITGDGGSKFMFQYGTMLSFSDTPTEIFIDSF